MFKLLMCLGDKSVDSIKVGGFLFLIENFVFCNFIIGIESLLLFVCEEIFNDFN